MEDIMDIIFPIAYILILIGLIIMFIRCIKKKSKWRNLFLSEGLAIIIAIFFVIFYDSLPGKGMMPGLTYFAEVIFSILAVCGFSIFTGISLITRIIIYFKERKN